MQTHRRGVFRQDGTNLRIRGLAKCALMIDVEQFAAFIVVEEQARRVEQLQRVIFRRIMRRRNREASARADCAGVKLDGRRRQHAHVDHFASGGQQSALHGVLQHGAGGARVASHHHASSADVGSEGLRERGLQVDTLTELFASSSWFTFIVLQLACLVFSAWLVTRHKITVGDAVMYQSYFGMLIGAVQQALGVFPVLAQGRDAIRSIGEILEAPEVEDYSGNRPAPVPTRGEIVFEDVSFQYPRGREIALQNISLRIAAGETVAFVGESGAGKSTLVNLAMGFRPPTSGRVLLDGHDLQELDLRTYRRQIGVVPQTTILFNGSLRENVTYGLEKVSDGKLWDILSEANLSEFARCLPQQLDTPLGESGTRLSGGQRQRLAIARALIRDPRVILLDEATSALDTESERLVQEALIRLTKGRTTLIVAHRFSTIRQAHRIVVLQGGKIVEVGTLQELMARGGHFTRLATLQSFTAAN